MNLDSLVRAAVNRFVDFEKPFTAFDITRKLRHDGHKVRHGGVKKVVHEIFLQGDLSDVGYERGLISIPNVNEQPFLYYPFDFDIEDYESEFNDEFIENSKKVEDEDEEEDEDNGKAKTAPTKKSAQIKKPKKPTKKNITLPPAVKRRTTQDYRVTIPAKIFRKWGLKHKDKIYVSVNQNNPVLGPCLEITAHQPSSAKTFRITKRNDCRLPGSLLKEIAVNHPGQVEILPSVTTSSLLITSA